MTPVLRRADENAPQVTVGDSRFSARGEAGARTALIGPDL
jgi:hypothetical protein